MAINIHHIYTANVEVRYYTEDGYTLHCRDYGTMDNIADQICEVLIKHNFSYADVCSVETGEVLMVIDRT